jgi:flagellar basal-body rod protein FlgC
MGVNGIYNPVDIAVSGLRAQSARLRVISSNIANAFTSRTPSGEPYRRQSVVLSTLLDELAGVEVLQVVPDMSTDFKRVLEPGHPDADANGYVLMPNVEVPTEMMHMVTAARAYQANAAVLKRYQELMDITLELLR